MIINSKQQKNKTEYSPKFCLICGGQLINPTNLGNQPYSHLYVSAINSNSYLSNLTIVICASCQTIQMEQPFNKELLLKKYSWINYIEPEDHLDNLAEIIQSEIQNRNDLNIIGLSLKDASLIERLKNRGLKNANLLFKKPIEKVNDIFSDKKYQSRKLFDVIIARHIIEHSYDINQFLINLKKICAPNSLIIIEIPDSTKIIEKNLYHYLWEEHIYYFTQKTAEKLFSYHKFESYRIKNYPYAYENSMVFFLKLHKDQISNITSQHSVNYLQFSNNYEITKKNIRSLLANHKRNGNIAIYGAGHLTIKFINFYDVSEFIEFVVDDDPHKADFLLPESKLTIQPSHQLIDKKIRTCLILASPESEIKIKAQNQNFIQYGGNFINYDELLKSSNNVSGQSRP